MTKSETICQKCEVYKRLLHSKLNKTNFYYRFIPKEGVQWSYNFVDRADAKSLNWRTLYVCYHHACPYALEHLMSENQ